MHSLAAKLTLAFLFVGLTGALLVALLVRWQTIRQFDRYVLDLYADELADLQPELQEHYQLNGSWEGVVGVLIREEGGHRPPNRSPSNGPSGDGSPGDGSPSFGRGQRGLQAVALVDVDGTVLTPSREHPVGQKLSAQQMRGAAPIEVDGERVGWLLLDSTPLGPDEQGFLNNVGRAALWSALGAAALALVVGAVLAQTISRPVRALTEATHVIAGGGLGQQVPVRTRDELGELATSFNRMSADLAHAVALRDQMTANVAHDLRTPLSALLGYTEALSEGKFQGSPAIYRILHQETQHLQRLVDDLHTLSLADAGELPVYVQPTAPAALLERVALAHRPQAEAKDIQLTVVLRDDLPQIEVDPERMVQVLGNLVRNALRHTPAGGRVTLGAEAGAGQVRLSVEDTGSGIAPEHLPHIWERLYQGDQARSQAGSSGLGLAIARSIVLAHGGTITAESEPGEGATFTIALPVSA